jgi:hypothetical protein
MPACAYVSANSLTLRMSSISSSAPSNACTRQSKY